MSGFGGGDWEGFQASQGFKGGGAVHSGGMDLKGENRGAQHELYSHGVQPAPKRDSPAV